MNIMDDITYLEHSGPLVYRNKHPNPMCPVTTPVRVFHHGLPAVCLFSVIGDASCSYFGVSGAHDGDDLRLLYGLAVDKLADYRRGVQIGITEQDDDYSHDLLRKIRALRLEMIDTAVMQALADISGREPSYVTPTQMCRYWLEIGVGQTAHYLIGCRWRTLFNTDEDHTNAR